MGSFTDANSNTTAYSYDGNNQLAGVRDPLGNSTTYGYDENWNLERILDARPYHYQTVFSYDEDSRLVSIDDPSGDPPVTFDYYGNGTLKRANQPTGEVTCYNYYANNLVRTINHAGSPLSYQFTYTPTNQLGTVTDNAGRVSSRSYDAADRLISSTDHNNPQRAAGFTVSYAYDDLSQLIGLSSPASSEALSYTPAGELDGITIPAGTIDFSYYPDGKVQSIAAPEGRSTRSYTYDAAGRTKKVENRTVSGTDTITYTHDNNGNTRRVDGTETYRYDELNRLTWWKDTDGGILRRYSYDQVGNLTEVKKDGVPVETFTYNGSNEITSPGYTYDESGNMTSDGECDYAYDAMNRLKEVKDHDTAQVIANYGYDYRGRRRRKNAGGVITYYHWEGNNLIAETNPTGAVKASYTYDDRGNPVSMRRGGEDYFYQTNAHGDVITLTDSSGEVVNTYTYDPWGKVLSSSEQVKNPIRYAGYIYDTETGMYYLMARYYDPGICRFLTRDMINIDLMARRNPVGFNRYAYCNDNPISSIDRQGLDAVTEKYEELKEARAYAERHPDDPAAQEKVKTLQKEFNAQSRETYVGCKRLTNIEREYGWAARAFARPITGVLRVFQKGTKVIGIASILVGGFSLRPDVVAYGWFCVRGSRVIDVWLSELERQLE